MLEYLAQERHARLPEGPALPGYLARKTPPPPRDHTVAPCLATYGDPRGAGFSYARGQLVGTKHLLVRNYPVARRDRAACDTGVPR